MARRNPQSAAPPYTPKQGQYLAFIHNYTKIHRCPPAESDMQGYFRTSAPSIHQMVVTLERKGFIAKTPGAPRSIRLLIPPESLPVLGAESGESRASGSARGSGAPEPRPAELPRPEPRFVWRRDPRAVKVSPLLKAEVESRMSALIEQELRPTAIRPPPPDPQSNYLVDLFTKWHGRYFYLLGKYRCPGPHAIRPFFDDGFARLEYAGGDRFNLSYMRHTGQWWEIARGLTLGECIQAIRDNPLLEA